MNDELYESEINCDHFLALIMLNSNHEPLCERCGQKLTDAQITIMALRGKEYCERMIEKERIK